MTYIKKRARWQSNLGINSPVVVGNIDGYVETIDKKNLVSSRLEVEYTLNPKQRRSKPERFTVSNKCRYDHAKYQYSLDT